ncbi:hypothetical protein VTI74DRAFT_7255 [Chaetomium olivicolor]
MEVGDERENPYKDAERRLVEARNEARIETELRVTAEMERGLAEEGIEMERRMDTEIKRRVTEGRWREKLVMRHSSALLGLGLTRRLL